MTGAPPARSTARVELRGEIAASRIQSPHRAASSSLVMPMIGRPIEVLLFAALAQAMEPVRGPRPGLGTFFLTSRVSDGTMTFLSAYLQCADWPLPVVTTACSPASGTELVTPPPAPPAAGGCQR